MSNREEIPTPSTEAVALALRRQVVRGTNTGDIFARLRAIASPLPSGLADLAVELAEKPFAKERTSGSTAFYPPRSPDQVLAQLAAGKAVAPLELWRVVRNQTWWAELRGRSAGSGRENEARVAAKLLWQASLSRPALRLDLRWQSACFLAGNEKACSPEIAGLIELSHPSDRPMLKIFATKDAGMLVDRAASAQMTPSELLDTAGFPSRTPLLAGVGKPLVARFMRSPEGMEQWLIRSLDELDLTPRDQAVDVLLGGLTDALAAKLPALREALTRWYPTPTLETAGLSGLSRDRLRGWAGLHHWDGLVWFVEQKYGFSLAELARLQRLGLGANQNEKDARRALGRVAFFRNYAAIISDMRLFVANEEDLDLFGSASNASSQWVQFDEHEHEGLLVQFDHLLVHVPLHRGKVEGQTVPVGFGEGVRAALVAVRRGGEERFSISGEWGWQSNLYYALLNCGIRPNAGLQAFESVDPNHLGPDHMPRRTSADKPTKPTKRPKRK